MYAGNCIRRSSTGIVFVFTGFLLITCCGYNILTFLQPNARTCDHNLSTFSIVYTFCYYLLLIYFLKFLSGKVIFPVSLFLKKRRKKFVFPVAEMN